VQKHTTADGTACSEVAEGRKFSRRRIHADTKAIGRGTIMPDKLNAIGRMGGQPTSAPTTASTCAGRNSHHSSETCPDLGCAQRISSRLGDFISLEICNLRSPRIPLPALTCLILGPKYCSTILLSDTPCNTQYGPNRPTRPQIQSAAWTV